MHPDYLEKILTAQVYDVAVETPLDLASNLSARIGNRLLLKREEEAAKKKELAGTITASWGDQMRSYFLYGQQLVKDLRTGYEVGNPAVVFDGDPTAAKRMTMRKAEPHCPSCSTASVPARSGWNNDVAGADRSSRSARTP